MADMRRRFEQLFDTDMPALWSQEGLAREAVEQLAALDLYETDDKVIVKVSLPGVRPEDISITTAGHTLTVKGETVKEQEVKDEHVRRQERYRGVFTRSVSLPDYANVEKAEAASTDGVLTITMPKEKQAGSRSIPVKAVAASSNDKAS
jgi:HSP20 family protein